MALSVNTSRFSLYSQCLVISVRETRMKCPNHNAYGEKTDTQIFLLLNAPSWFNFLIPLFFINCQSPSALLVERCMRMDFLLGPVHKDLSCPKPSLCTVSHHICVYDNKHDDYMEEEAADARLNR